MIKGLFDHWTIHHSAPPERWPKRTSIVLFLAVIALFSFLGTPGLKEPDEGRYAEIGREMATSNDWLIPHLNGFEHFQKPPLLYWATAVSIKIFGATEWSARLPSALAAAGVLLLTLWIGTCFFGLQTGALAAVILVSSFEFFALGRILNTDMMLAFWATASTACFLRWTITPQVRRWEWLSFIAMGFAFLTKGPVGVLVPLSVMLVLYLHGRWVKVPLPIYWFRGLSVALTIGLSWFLAVVVVHPELLNYFLGFELFQRTVGSARGRQQAVWFYFPVLFLGAFPWSLFAVCGFVSSCRKYARQKFRRIDLALCLWIILPLTILTIIRSKLPTYVLPLFPAIALMVADWIRSQATPRMIRRLISTTAIISVVLLGVPFLLPYFSHQMRHLQPAGTLLLVEAIVFGGTALVNWWAADKMAVTFLVYVLSSGALLAWIIGFVNLDTLDQGLGEQASVRAIASKLSNASDLSESRIYCLETRAHGIEFYTHHFVWESEDKADLALAPAEDQKSRLILNNDQWEKSLDLGFPVYLVTTRQELQKLTRPWQELASSGSYLLLKLATGPISGLGSMRMPDAKREGLKELKAKN